MNLNSEYYVYIVTNEARDVLYCGVTSNLPVRLERHFDDAGNKTGSMPGRNGCCHLVYYETYDNAKMAMHRQYLLGRMNKTAKEKLISAFNPGWPFLNERFANQKVVC